LFRLRRYDVVYLHLWVTPFGPPFFEWLFCKTAKRVVYDIDDMIYLTPPNSPNPAINWLKGKGKPIYLFKKSDYVLTSTPAIEEYARKFNERVINVPITISTEKYIPRDQYHADKVVVGWSGSVSTSPYLHLLDNVLLELRKRFDFKLLVMGDPSFNIEGLEIEAIPWKEEYEVSTIRRFDIGLYPLPADSWVHGKGGGKALQYMAAGVPTVATAIGANFKIIEHGVSGYLVKTDEEWLSCLEQLITNEQLRAQIGRKGVEVVEEKFSVRANKEVYLSVLRDASSQ
jgi:glycosyltransferase involved in cell wall biosynthesis